MSSPVQYREFSRLKEAKGYALSSGLPLGKRVNDARLRKLLSPYFVGKFSPYHYTEITLDRS